MPMHCMRNVHDCTAMELRRMAGGCKGDQDAGKPHHTGEDAPALLSARTGTIMQPTVPALAMGGAARHHGSRPPWTSPARRPWAPGPGTGGAGNPGSRRFPRAPRRSPAPQYGRRRSTEGPPAPGRCQGSIAPAPPLPNAPPPTA